MSNIVYKKNPFSTPFLRGYKKLKIPIMDSRGNPAWPELFPPDAIEQMRQTVGARHFASQMMLESVGLERVRLDPGGIQFYDWEFDVRTARIGDNLITGLCLYWDPSSGRRRADASALALIYRDDRNRRIFLDDILYLTVSDSEQYPLSHQCDMVLDFMGRHNLRRIYIETNGIGGGLPEIMRDVATRRGTNIVVQRISNSRAKSDRILDAIEPVLTTGRLYMHTRIQSTPLLAEMLGWSPLGSVGHDDGLDAVAGAIAQTPIPVHATGTNIRPINANTNFSV